MESVTSQRKADVLSSEGLSVSTSISSGLTSIQVEVGKKGQASIQGEVSGPSPIILTPGSIDDSILPLSSTYLQSCIAASRVSNKGRPNNGFNRTTDYHPNSSTHGRPSKQTKSSETRVTSEKIPGVTFLVTQFLQSFLGFYELDLSD